MPDHIRVIAICVFRHGDKILVFEAFDSVDGKPFYRPLGGGVEFGETTEAAIRREIKEEIGQETTDFKLLTILENIFTNEGKAGHEIVYVYDGRFTDAAAYRRESFKVTEDSGEVLTARWHSLDFFNDYHRLVPDELVSLLKAGS
ncbi:MAG: NUDIX domain-containing protein [Dehalococcoidales bacterium]|jgi:ADP-ribose pyrophosphatase YjhB (NUDIX family)